MFDRENCNVTHGYLVTICPDGVPTRAPRHVSRSGQSRSEFVHGAVALYGLRVQFLISDIIIRFLRIQDVQMLGVEPVVHHHSERDEQSNQQREQDAQGKSANFGCLQNPKRHQPQQLEQCEQVNGFHWNLANVVRLRIQRRVGDPQANAIEEVIPAQGRKAHVQKQAKQNGVRYQIDQG